MHIEGLGEAFMKNIGRRLHERRGMPDEGKSQLEQSTGYVEEALQSGKERRCRQHDDGHSNGDVEAFKINGNAKRVSRLLQVG